jgi:hypothetical protein
MPPAATGILIPQRRKARGAVNRTEYLTTTIHHRLGHLAGRKSNATIRICADKRLANGAGV